MVSSVPRMVRVRMVRVRVCDCRTACALVNAMGGVSHCVCAVASHCVLRCSAVSHCVRLCLRRTACGFAQCLTLRTWCCAMLDASDLPAVLPRSLRLRARAYARASCVRVGAHLCTSRGALRCRVGRGGSGAPRAFERVPTAGAG